MRPPSDDGAWARSRSRATCFCKRGWTEHYDRTEDRLHCPRITRSSVRSHWVPWPSSRRTPTIAQWQPVHPPWSLWFSGPTLLRSSDLAIDSRIFPSQQQPWKMKTVDFIQKRTHLSITVSIFTEASRISWGLSGLSSSWPKVRIWEITEEPKSTTVAVVSIISVHSFSIN